MTFVELEKRISQSDSKTVGWLALGLAAQTSSYFRGFCYQNKLENAYKSFQRTLTCTLTSTYIPEFDPESLLYNPDKVADQVFTLTTPSLAIYAYRNNVEGKECREDIVLCFINELRQLADLIVECNSNLDVLEEDIPAELVKYLRIHYRFLSSKVSLEDYIAECNLEQLPVGRFLSRWLNST